MVLEFEGYFDNVVVVVLGGVVVLWIDYSGDWFNYLVVLLWFYFDICLFIVIFE